ncbi:MAG: hypothetical protein AABZ31_11340 [Bdellovibrionota bacterium]
MRHAFIIFIGAFAFSANVFAQSSADAATINNSTSVKAASTGSLSAPIETLHIRPSKWSTSAFLGNWGDVGALNGGPKNQSFTDVYLEPKKDIGHGQSLAFRINAQQYERGDKNKDKMVLGDPQFLYRNKVFSTSARISIPVLEQSRLTGRHEIRLNGGTDLLKLDRFTAGLLLEGRAYAYTKDNDGQLAARARNGVGLTYALSDRVSPYFNALYDIRWANSGSGSTILNVDANVNPENEVRKHWFDLGASFVVIPKHLNFDAYVTQIRDEDSNSDFLAKEDTGYNFELSATF